jgi:transcriptional regulator with XRE-family HTH domain
VNELGKLLRELRQAKGLSVRAAAHQLGISHSRLSDFERGSTHGGKFTAVPSRDVLVKMTALYSYPLRTLLALAGLPDAEPSIPPKPSKVEVEVSELAGIYRSLPEPHQRIFLKLARTYKAEVAELGGE